MGVHQQLFGVHQQLLGVHQKLLGVHRQLLGVHQKLLGVHQKLLGVHQQLLGVHQQLLGVYQQLLDVHQQLLDVHQQLLGVHQQLLGVHQQILGVHQQLLGVHQQLFGFHLLGVHQQLFEKKNILLESKDNLRLKVTKYPRGQNFIRIFYFYLYNHGIFSRIIVGEKVDQFLPHGICKQLFLKVYFWSVRYGHLSEEIFRACRLVVDTGKFLLEVLHSI